MYFINVLTILFFLNVFLKPSNFRIHTLRENMKAKRTHFSFAYSKVIISCSATATARDSSVKIKIREGRKRSQNTLLYCFYSVQESEGINTYK